jgi:uncharacterized protein YkwD
MSVELPKGNGMKGYSPCPRVAAGRSRVRGLARVRRLGLSLSQLPAVGAILIIAASCSAAQSTGPDNSALTLQMGIDIARDAAVMINQHRAGRGCTTLAWHVKGAEVGEKYAVQMSQQEFFGHVDPAGGTLKSRLTGAGIAGYKTAAETIAAGQRTAHRVVEAWLESPDHREILEDCQFQHVGVGFHAGEGPYQAYWTAVFLATR